MRRIVGRHLEQSLPAPQADATSRTVVAPSFTTRAIVPLVTPRHRHTHMHRMYYR